MSHPNLDVVLDAYHAFEAGDLEAAGKNIADEFAWDESWTKLSARA